MTDNSLSSLDYDSDGENLSPISDEKAFTMESEFLCKFYMETLDLNFLKNNKTCQRLSTLMMLVWKQILFSFHFLEIDNFRQLYFLTILRRSESK